MHFCALLQNVFHTNRLYISFLTILTTQLHGIVSTAHEKFYKKHKRNAGDTGISNLLSVSFSYQRWEEIWQNRFLEKNEELRSYIGDMDMHCQHIQPRQPPTSYKTPSRCSVTISCSWERRGWQTCWWTWPALSNRFRRWNPCACVRGPETSSRQRTFRWRDRWTRETRSVWRLADRVLPRSSRRSSFDFPARCFSPVTPPPTENTIMEAWDTVKSLFSVVFNLAPVLFLPPDINAWLELTSAFLHFSAGLV